MSVEARDSMSDVWTRWQGHVINGVFPLGRYVGCSDHSGVFLTKSVAPRPSEVAIKLVPANRTLTEYHLPRWKRAAALAQPHLLRLLEWGGCQLDGSPHLYLIMEYADQTLAQLLLSRAMTEDEAREMLPPILDALAFLHRRGLAQGQLKPANILVVGDQLKLASDTIRGINESVMRTGRLTAYDAPEALHGRGSTAADIWALGISLFEALTRRLPSGCGEHKDAKDAVALPANFSPAFRDVVARCLSFRAHDRPSVKELVDWAGGRSVKFAPTAHSHGAVVASREPKRDEPKPLEPKAPEPKAPEPKAHEPITLEPITPGPITPGLVALEPVAPEPTRAVRMVEPLMPEPLAPRIAPPQAVPEPAPSAPLMADILKPRALLAVVVGAIVIFVLGWTGVHVFSPHRSGTAVPTRIGTSAVSPSAIPGAAAPTASTSGIISREPGGVSTSPSAVHEVIPDVAPSARRTIRGHIKVWVRVIVVRDGSVFAAVADRTGPSRYFLRLAIEAAKKWTFASADAPARRLMQIRFDFSRQGTTAQAVPLH